MTWMMKMGSTIRVRASKKINLMRLFKSLLGIILKMEVTRRSKMTSLQTLELNKKKITTKGYLMMKTMRCSVHPEGHSM